MGGLFQFSDTFFKFRSFNNFGERLHYPRQFRGLRRRQIALCNRPHKRKNAMAKALAFCDPGAAVGRSGFPEFCGLELLGWGSRRVLSPATDYGRMTCRSNRDTFCCGA